MTESPFFDQSPAATAPVLTVSLLNRLARERLESAFPLCWVAGEISNLTYASSGHVYFSLKDSNAQVRCVMFRNRAQLLGWRLENGQHIEARVLVTLYEARGDYQLNVETARRGGVGNLFEQFLRLKAKLESEGLFATEHKRPLPAFPQRLGIVTSPQAAALRDVLTTLARRAPHVGIVLYPTPVQGEGAPGRIVSALTTASDRHECDALILCRGGGSLEDLWAFNDEAVARAIRACKIPIVTGVGHETDFTIADFAADHRAATPTAAAELAAPHRAALMQQCVDQLRMLTRLADRSLERRAQHLDMLAKRLISPAQRLVQRRQLLAACQSRLTTALQQAVARGTLTTLRLSQRLRLARPNTERLSVRLTTLSERLNSAMRTALDSRSTRLAHIGAGLAHLSPDNVLARGYSIVTDESGRILNSSRGLEPNDRINVSFHAGRAEARITAVQP